ncbi:MAG: ATP-dependent Clp protease ATP-binding subunit [Spirochaetales bacterium]|nr:ATP-dependent Clp protease ATP-binding subunit [Spirochaetales bacterium]
MFKGLTQRAQRVLSVIAQEEAKRSRADQLTPEHVLSAIVRDAEGFGARALRALKMDLAELRAELERNSGGRRSGFVLGDVPLSRRLKSLLETAAEEAHLAGSEYIGTEHLVIAAAREGGSAFERFLEERGVFYEQVRAAVRLVGAGESRERPTPSEGPRREDVREAAMPRQRATQQARTPILDEYSRDLTALARSGRIDPVIGRESEIRRVVRILSRRTKNNPVLVGEPGVGKTAIVEGLALRIGSGSVPDQLAGKRILSLDIASVVAGTKYRGEFEERLKRIMKEISQAGDVVLFIDELHTVIGAGSAEGTIDASNMLKPALSRGEIQCIGATTLAEYRKYFEKDAALERRFQLVLVEEPSPEQAVEILLGIKGRYEDYHGVAYARDAVEAAVSLSRRYLADRFLPDKAIDLMDEAGAKRRIEDPSRPPELPEVESEIAKLTEEKLALVSTQNYERAAEVRDRVRRLKERLESIRSAWESDSGRARGLVTEQDVREVVSDATGIPVARLEENESARLLGLEDELHRRVIGQDDAIRAVAAAVRRSRAGIADERRPLGSFVFLGPTGVGKTLVAKTLAEYLFGSEDALIRVDMSDYMEKHNASRLVGAPPGYVGYDQGGMLTEKIRRRPYSVILFDEIEKAHPDVFNLLLQLLEEGELRDNLGHTVSFRNAVVVMTSNAGTRDIARGASLGFRAEDARFDLPAVREAALSELKRQFRPEFVNRVDEVVVFHPLGRAEVSKVLTLMLTELERRLAAKGVALELKAAARERLVEKGYEPAYGARPMRRLITREIEDPLADAIIAGKCPPGSTVCVDWKGESFVVKPKPRGRKADPDPLPVPAGVPS